MNAVIFLLSNCLPGHHHVGPVVAVLQLDVGLVLHAVQVLVQTVQQEGQQLLHGVFESSLGLWPLWGMGIEHSKSLNYVKLYHDSSLKLGFCTFL